MRWSWTYHCLCLLLSSSSIRTGALVVADDAVSLSGQRQKKNNRNKETSHHRLLRNGAEHELVSNDSKCCHINTTTTMLGEKELDITWSKKEEEIQSCPLQSLYLNNTGKTVTCIPGWVENNDNSQRQQDVYYFGPGPVPSLFWGGAYDCQGNVDIERCTIRPFVFENESSTFYCSNQAAFDVQYTAIRTLQFLHDNLRFHSIITKRAKYDTTTEQPTLKAFVHYDQELCNAFYRRFEDTIYFGDCDCQIAGPMVSVDIVAHEVSHFVTWHTSQLAYGYESGGLSEGYGDILGTMMEWIISDTTDIPDFFIGESTSKHLVRDMWQGSTADNNGNNANNIEILKNVCQFDIRQGAMVHVTSGPLNRAYISAVKACTESTCSSSMKECVVLIGSIFFYSNMHKLSMYSGYVDAATASCESVEELYFEHKPETLCSVDDVYTFMEEGWEAVNILFKNDGSVSNQCQARKNCEGELEQTLATRTFLSFSGILNRLVQVKDNLF